VLGLGMDFVIQQYIVLLDKPILGQKAILVQNTLMVNIQKRLDSLFGELK
jgi:hypothetical protein